ncbi:MAG: peptide ABC transporter substrate-binding protein [Chloroflexi bacterium]|nr:MAG: peptide ABC transporter substrate-binding protein [Chloroflexota bacterium]
MRKLVALSLLVVLAVAACTPSSTGTGTGSPTPAAAKKTTLRLPEAAKIVNTMDPGISSGGAGLEQIQNTFEGLAYVDQVSGEIKPGQAEKWTISPDGLTYTFNLRSGLKWSDGQALKASDFEYAWKRATDPATKSRYAQTLWPVKGAEAFGTGKGAADGMAVKATDDKTLVVTLERPAPFFMHLAATWTAYPIRKDTIDKNGDKWTLTKDTYISNGHYRLVEWKAEQSMTVEKNPNYWGENNGPDTIVWTLYDDVATKSVIAYEAGEIDRAVLVGADITRAKADATLSIVAPGIPGQKKENALGYDVAKAKQLLSEAGYPDGKNFPTVKFTFASGASENKAIAEAVQGIWKSNLGIDIVLEPMEDKAFDNWRTTRKDQPFGMYVSGWGSDYEDPNNWYNLLFHSKADFFYAHWKNTDFDNLIDQGLKENDVAKRKTTYESADKIINTEAPYITVYHWARFDLIKPYIEGLNHYRVLGRIQGYLVRVKK